VKDTRTMLCDLDTPRATNSVASRDTCAPEGSSRPARLAPSGEYLSFRIGAEEYALGILAVQEIRSYEPATRLSGVSPCIKGVVNLRGVIVPIVDLRLALGIQAPSYDTFTVVIVLNVLQRVVGVVVDSVSDVVNLKPGDIRAAPELHGAASADFINGLAALRQPDADGNATGERMLILADLAHLLASPAIGLVEVDRHMH
jgi:purine-binding chemotaxis protein CheW